MGVPRSSSNLEKATFVRRPGLTASEREELNVRLGLHIIKGEVWEVILLIKAHKKDLDKYHMLGFTAHNYWEFPNGEEILKFVLREWDWTLDVLEKNSKKFISGPTSNQPVNCPD